MGVIGVVLTLAGLIAGMVSLWLAWKQVREAVTAAEAAADAARRSRRDHDRLILSLAHRANAEARLLVSAERFDAADLKCTDLADFMALVAVEPDAADGGRSAWGELADEARGMAEQFRRVAAEELKWSKTLQVKWSRPSVRVGSELPAGLAPPLTPDPPPGGETHAG